MKKTKKLTNHVWKKFYSLMVALMATFLLAVPVYASKIGDSKLAQGTQNLFNDLSTWLLILSPIAGTVLTIYFLIRKSGADDVDQKKWQNRINVAIACTIFAAVAGTTINVLLSYYQ